MNIYQQVLDAKEAGKKLLAVLIDPEKINIEQVHSFIKIVHSSIATHILVGGSTDDNHTIEDVVVEIKKYTTLPVILFPGNAKQVTSKADGILFLNLISGRNPKYLIEQQVESALTIQKSGLEVIPTGYVLLDGGKETSVQKISQTKPIDQTDYELILKTALAGQFMGQKLIYLEAGSGAKNPVSPVVVHCVKSELKIPLIVGGGIRDIQQLQNAYNAGADMVVIGTAFEKNISFFNELKKETFYENISRVDFTPSSK